MTPQEIFNKAYLGVIKQGRLSQKRGGDCRYYFRSKGEVLHCGVGQLLDNATAKTWDRRVDSSIAAVLCPTKRQHLPEAYHWMLEHEELLGSIQTSHDQAFTLDDFKNYMKDVAENYNLTIPELADA